MWRSEWRQCRFKVTDQLGEWGEEKREFEKDWLAWVTRSKVVLVTRMGTWRGMALEDEFWLDHLP